MTYPYQPGPYQPGQPPPPDPPVQAYQVPVYYYPYSPYGPQPPAPTEGFAIASLVLSSTAVLSLCAYGIGGLLGLIGAIMGHVARGRIRRNGTQGDGLALAGIIVGWIVFGLTVAAAVLLAILIANDPEFTET